MRPLKIKKTINSLWLLLCMAVVICGCSKKTDQPADVVSYAVEKDYYCQAMHLKVKVSSDHVILSDLVLLEMSLEVKPGYEGSFPVLQEALKQFKIRTSEQLPPKLGDDGKILKLCRYKLEPLEIGQCEIPVLTFEFEQKGVTEVESETGTLQTEAIPIEVTTSISADMQEPAIADIEDIVEVKPDRTIFWMVVAAVVLLAAVTAVVITVKPKKAVQIKRVYKPAHQIAFEMLRLIAAERLVEQGLVKEFYEKLSNCLRQYIENRFSLRAPEQTTEEFLEQLKQSDELKLEYKAELKKFLNHCDLVKFARYQPTEQQINESLTMAEGFVDKTKSEEHQIDVTAEVGEK